MALKNKNPHLARWEWIALVVVVLLATWLRLGRTGIIEFKRDEATLSRLALDVAQRQHWTWVGIGSSVGFPNAPINVYLFAVPYAISDNPLLATLFVGFLNIVAVALVWRLTRRYFGPQAAVMAALLFATSPWAALYARKIWAQDLLPPFVLLTAFTGILGFLEGKRWAQLFHLPLLALTVQIHFGAISWVPISAVLILLGWRNWSRWLWAGVALAVLLSLPYLYGLYDADLLSLSALRESLSQSSEGTPPRERHFETTAFDHAWLVVSGRDIHALAGEDAFQDYLDTIPPVYSFFSILPLLTLLSLPVLGYLAYRRRDLRLWLILALWLIVPILAFSYTWAEPQPHYMLPMLPVAFVLIGALLAQGWHWPMVRPVISIGLVVMVVLQAFVVLRLLDFLGKTDTPGAFGTPLAYQLPIREALLDDAPQRVIVVSNGNSPQFDQAPAVWDVLLDRLPNVDFLAANHWWIIPDRPTPMLIAPETSAAWREPLRGTSTSFPLRDGEGNYQLWRDFSVALPDNLTTIEGAFANGVILESVQREADVLWLVWRIPNPASQTLPIAFVHGLDVNDQRIQQVDQPFIAEAYWLAGDRLLWRVEMSLSDVQTLRIGLYVLVGEAQFQNIEHLDTNGVYVDQWIVLPVAMLG